MNIPKLFVQSALFASAAILLFSYQIESQQQIGEGTRPDEMADLVAVSISPSIAFPKPNEIVDVAVKVLNRSLHIEHGVTVTLFAGGVKVAERAVNLKSGKTATVYLAWKARTEGNISLTAHVDLNNKFIELNKYDNLTSTDVVVTRESSNQADLAILKIESVKDSDQSVILRVIVRNNGKLSAQVPLVIKTDKGMSAVQLVNIAADTTLNVDFPIADSHLAGPVSAEVNPRFRSKEKHPSDNLFVADLRPSIDLRIEGLSVSAEKYERTRPRQVTISFRVVNIGAAAITRAFRTSIFPGIVKSSNDEEPFDIHYVTTGGLPAGATVYISQTIVSPIGEFDVHVQTDVDNVVTETDEGNNALDSHFKNPTPDIDRWVSIGPTSISDGGLGAIGRIHSIAIHPTTPETMYVGAPNCGIWKTTNGGASWIPVSDSLPTLALAALAVDPVTPTRVYAVFGGMGVYRSDDAATSWTQISNDIGTLAGAGVLLIDPTTPSRLYLNAGSNGLFRSNDSGVTWNLIKTGTVNDVVMDPSNPATLYAGLQSDGVYKTTSRGGNGDSAWVKLSGLPTTGFTRVTLALSQSAQNTVFAGLSGSPFRLFRSTNGTNFSLRFTAASSIYNPWIRVDPINSSLVFVLSNVLFRSTDGGATFPTPTGANADLHECQGFAFDPVTPGVAYLGRDTGIYRSADRGVNWEQIGEGIPNVEFYDHAVAFQDPNLIIGGTQDNGTIRYDGTSTIWNEFWGGDGATVDIDPTNSNLLYLMNQGQGSMVRWDNGTPSCIGCTLPSDPPTTCSNLHFQVHPGAPSTLLASCLSLWRANNPRCPTCPSEGSSGTLGVWSPILPATMTAPGNVARSTIDRSTDLYYAGTTIGELWAGPGGRNWRKIFTPTSAPKVTDIEVDQNDPAVIYVSLEVATGDRVYRLQRTPANPTLANTVSQSITTNLPTNITVKTLAVDQKTPFTVYAGTNRGIYRGRSLNCGSTWSWTAYNNGMPQATDVRDLEVHPVTGILRAATYGRSAYEVTTDSPGRSLFTAEGKIIFLRVNDVGTGFGPTTDFLNAEVIVQLDTKPGRGFGLTLRNDSDNADHRGMFELLRSAFRQNRTVRLDYICTGIKNGRIIRVESFK